MNCKYTGRKMSILQRYTLSSIIMLIFAVLIVSVILYFYFSNSRNSYHDDLKQQCDLASNNVGLHISRLQEQSNIPIYREPDGYDTHYLSALKDSASSNEVTFSYYNSFLSTAKLIFSGNAKIHSIYSFNKNLDVLIWERNANDYPPSIDPSIWQKESELARGGIVFLGALHLSDGSYVYGVSRALLDVPHTDIIGYFIITEAISNLQESCDSMLMMDSQQYQIIDSNGVIISSSNAHLRGSNYTQHIGIDTFHTLMQDTKASVKLDGTTYLLAASPIPGTDWFVISSVESNQISADLHKTLVFISTAVIFLSCAVSISSIYMFHSAVVAPVNALIATIQNSGMLLNITDKPLNEVNFLSASYDQLQSIIEDLQSDNYLAMLRRKQLEIELLQVQINPHFLYNTLESIRMMAEIHNDTESAEMTYALSKILRYSLGTDDKITTLREEVSIVKDYVFLQQHRIDNIKDIQINIPKMYGNILIPKLILQPIVENSIVHGLYNTTHAGVISLDYIDTVDRFTVSVSDNGCGISPEKLATLNHDLANSEDRSVGSIGLRNVNRRLKLLFGKAYGLRIESVLNQGTTVYLDLPPIERTHP